MTKDEDFLFGKAVEEIDDPLDNMPHLDLDLGKRCGISECERVDSPPSKEATCDSCT